MSATMWEVADLKKYVPHGCKCTENGTACKRCVAQRERIRRLYSRGRQVQVEEPEPAPQVEVEPMVVSEPEPIPEPSTPSPKVRKCQRCESAPWTCRECGKHTCEHLCGNKTDDGKATCSACSIRGGK